MCSLVIKVSSFVAKGNCADLHGKAIINFAKARQTAKANHEPEPSLGVGVAMAIGLFLLTICASVGQHQVSCTMKYLLLNITHNDAVLLAFNGNWGTCKSCSHQVHLLSISLSY